MVVVSVVVLLFSPQMTFAAVEAIELIVSMVVGRSGLSAAAADSVM